MKKTTVILISLLLTVTVQLKAQVGIGTTSPNASSALEVQSTTKGVLISRMTDVQRTGILTPAEGLMVYQTNAPVGLWMFISGQWVRLTTTTDGFGPSTGFAANTNGNVIAVVLGGTPVPLPNSQNLGTGITVNGANTIFTVANAGRYRISYAINLTAALLVNSQILINGTGNTALTIVPVLSLNRQAADAIVTLAAGSTIALQLYGLLGAATLLPGSQGAALTIQRVE